jgi:hypothetical protein
MQANKTVTINGRIYDAVTGLPVAAKPVAKAEPAKKPTVLRRAAQVSAAAVHTTTQRSKTLNRRAIKKPAVVKRPQPGRHMDIARSSKVARFAPHPVIADEPKKSTPDIAPKTHPTASRALARVAHTKKAVSMTPKEVKDAAIAAALAKPTAKTKAKRFNIRFSRRFMIITGIAVILILGAYLTYANIPSISVDFAASQAGISATYPQYLPDGYHLNQPVTYSDGQVVLKFQSNSTSTGYTITQTRSSWDSSAVLDNVVKKAVGDNYVTTQDHGLTLYSYDNNAVWVNGGILYTIASTAPLSGEQIRNIATSL